MQQRGLDALSSKRAAKQFEEAHEAFDDQTAVTQVLVQDSKRDLVTCPEDICEVGKITLAFWVRYQDRDLVKTQPRR